MGFLAGIFGGGANPYKAQGLSPDQLQQAFQLAQAGAAQQQQFVNALNPTGLQGLAAQQQLLQQLGQQAQGQGPNPALQQLANTTGQNIAQQAALQASQRGVGQNAGMIARQAAQQGGQLQQQAAGQAALLRAQQQLAAQQALGQQAAQSVGQQQQGLQTLNAAQQGLTGQALGSVANQNEVNAGAAKQSTDIGGGILKGVGNAIGSALGFGLFAEGGEVPQQQESPMSPLGQYFHNMQSGGKVAGKAEVAGDSEKNDKVPAMLSPGEIVIPRSHATDPKKAAAFAAAVIARHKGKH